MAVEKVSSRARRRVAKPSSNAAITQLRDRETINYTGQTDDIVKTESSPAVTASEATQSSNNLTGSRRSARDDRHNAPRSARQFISNHKKGGIVAVVLAVVAVLVVVVSVLISGPMQFLQFTGLVKNTIQFMSDSVTSTRVMRNVLDIAQGASYSPGSSDPRDIGGMSRLVTDYYTKSLGQRGIEFDGGPSITIDLENRYKQTNQNEQKIITRVSDEFQIDSQALTYSASDQTVTIDTSNLSSAESERLLMALEKEVDNFAINELSATRRQLDTRRLQLQDWLHTISRTDQAELRKTMSHLEAWYASRLAKMTGQPLRDSNNVFRDDLAAELKDILDVKMAKRVTNINIDTANATTDDWMLLALAMACVDNRVYSSSGMTSQLYSRVVIPAIIEALTLRSIGGQIYSIALNTTNNGLQDFSFDDLTGPTQDYFYDELTAGGETVGVNGWSGAPVKAALGYNYDEIDMARTVDYALRFLELKDDVTGANNPAAIVGSGIYSICTEFFSNSELTEAISNFLGSDLSDEANGVLGWIESTFNPEQVYWRNKVQGVGEYSLQTFGMDPSQKLSTAMYGSKFFEDYDNTLLGGKALDDLEVAAIYGQAQTEIANDYQNKSAWDKLFDTSDYRSAVATLARDSNWDVSNSSALGHLANLAKTFAKLPSTTLKNLSAIFAPQANAAFTNLPYKYGTNWYGFSSDEKVELSGIGNQSTIFANAQKFFDLIKNDGMVVNITSIDCFSTQITQGGVLGNRVVNVWAGQNLLNADGTFNVNYTAGSGLSYYGCYYERISPEKMILLRTYLLDYNLMAAGACYLSVAYPAEKFDSNGDGQPDKTYETMKTPACNVFM
jgi:preprotein translocase subunit SecF